MPTDGVLNFSQSSNSKFVRNFVWSFADDFPVAIAERIVSMKMTRVKRGRMLISEDNQRRQMQRDDRDDDDPRKAASTMAADKLRLDESVGRHKVPNAKQLIIKYDRRGKSRKQPASVGKACCFIPHGNTEPRTLPRGRVVGSFFARLGEYRSLRPHTQTYLVHVRKATGDDIVAVRCGNVWQT